MKSISIAVGLILLLFAVSLQSQTVTAAQKAEIEKAVKGQILQGVAALNSMNVDAFMQGFSRDKFIGTMTTTGLEPNLEKIQKDTKTSFETLVSCKVEVLDIRVDVLSPDLAFAFCRMTERYEFKNGNATAYNHANMMVLAKEAGGWKVIHVADSRQTKK